MRGAIRPLGAADRQQRGRAAKVGVALLNQEDKLGATEEEVEEAAQEGERKLVDINEEVDALADGNRLSAAKADWVANKRFEISKFKFKIPRARTSELHGSFSAVSKPNFACK